MRIAKVIIGANFGDEGKGLLTDYFCHKDGHNCVVRFNGGAQAGHTVVTPDDKRHIFKHLGSGSFLGASTHLSKFFISNPMLFKEEYEDFTKKTGIKPKVTVDPESIVTTPYDMIINQAAEKIRLSRLGSCGIGINETIKRCNIKHLALRVKDLNTRTLRKVLDSIGTLDYFTWRIHQNYKDFIKKTLIKPFITALENPKLQEDFIESVKFFLCNTTIMPDKLALVGNVIFEGAQGLLLHESNLDYWPHLTPSKTGIHNVGEIAKSAGIDFLDITYVTRCYMTRHGPGKFYSETTDINIKDKTNKNNPFQGRLRFGYLDCERLRDRLIAEKVIRIDAEREVSLAITCLDQIKEIPIYRGHNLIKLSGDDLAKRLGDYLNLPIYKSYGPKRTDIIKM